MPTIFYSETSYVHILTERAELLFDLQWLDLTHCSLRARWRQAKEKLVQLQDESQSDSIQD